MKCIKCKKKIPDKSKFCNYCGTKQVMQHFYRRKDGLYEKIMNINGKRVAFRAKTEDGVFEKIMNYQEKQEKGLTFSEAADLWYDEHWESLSPTTQQGYKFAYDEILDYFGDDYIKQITHKDINQYIKQLPKTYARKTCLTRLSLLSMIFKHAIVEDYISENPCQYVTISKIHKSKKRRAPTSEEINIIKRNIDIEYKGFNIGFFVLFFLYTGLRKGEALALQYRDIDRNAALISVTKSVYFENNQPKLKPPKTEAGEREVIIPNIILNLLPNGKPKEYIFTEPNGTPMRNHFFEKAWAHWQDETGLDLTAHQLRHGHATLLHDAGVDVKDAQDQLGHADASTTQNIYTEVSAVRKNQTAKIFNEFLTQ